MNIPINPVEFAAGLILPLPDGRAIWALAPLAEDASEPSILHFNRYISALRGLGHTVVVGGQAELCAALAEVIDGD